MKIAQMTLVEPFDNFIEPIMLISSRELSFLANYLERSQTYKDSY